MEDVEEPLPQEVKHDLLPGFSQLAWVALSGLAVGGLLFWFLSR